MMTRGIYDRKYNVIDVAAQGNKLTHILYAFANLQEDGQVVLGVSDNIEIKKTVKNYLCINNCL